MNQSPHFRIVEPPPRAASRAGSELIECASGDSLLIARVRDSVLLSIDDVDGTVVPTARLTKLEARRIGLALISYSDRR